MAMTLSVLDRFAKKGVVGNLLLVLLEIYCSLQQLKNFGNPPRIDNVIAMVRVAPFFDSRCSSIYTL